MNPENPSDRAIRRYAAIVALLGSLVAPVFAAEVPSRLISTEWPSGPGVRNDAWRIIGMGGGGTICLIQASPIDPNIVLAASDMSGAYITRDGGKSWRSFYLLEGVENFAFDPTNVDVFYALNQALWRSDNGGRTWKMICPDPKSVTEISYVSTDADRVMRSSEPAFNQWRYFQRLAINPMNSKELFAVANGSLGHSTNGGKTWEHLAPSSSISITQSPTQALSQSVPPPQVGPSSVLTMDFRPDHPLLVVYKERVLAYPDMYLPPPGTESIRAAAIGVDRKTGGRMLYVTTPITFQNGRERGGIYLSRNDGKDWENLTPALLQHGQFMPGEHFPHPPAMKAVSCCGSNAQTVYLSFQGLRTGPKNGDIFNGIARSWDTGAHWEIVHAEGETADTNMTVSYCEQRALMCSVNAWFDSPRSLSVPAANGTMCYASDAFRVYRTGDGGGSWNQVSSAFRGTDCWETSGIDVTTCYGVHWDPFDTNHLFITYTDVGLQQSYDGGKSWTTAFVGVPNDWQNTAYWIAFDPAVKGLMWCAVSAVHDLPHPRIWRKNGLAGFDGGVCISTNAGKSWSVSSAGLPPMATTHVLLDPASPVGSRTLYACGFGHGVYKSVDNGATWALKNNGIELNQPFAWRLTRAGNGTLYLVIARRSENGEIGDSNDGALYKSDDGAEHWTKLALPSGSNGPMEISVDPRDFQRLYQSLWGRYVASGDVGGGICVSTNGGVSWSPLFTGNQHVYSVTVDSKKPDRLFACGFEGSAYRSDDAGQHWWRLQGFNFKQGQRVFVDPTNPDRIYITTFGNSVWTGPADGDPHALEDIETPLPMHPGIAISSP